MFRKLESKIQFQEKDFVVCRHLLSEEFQNQFLMNVDIVLSQEEFYSFVHRFPKQKFLKIKSSSYFS